MEKVTKNIPDNKWNYVHTSSTLRLERIISNKIYGLQTMLARAVILICFQRRKRWEQELPIYYGYWKRNTKSFVTLTVDVNDNFINLLLNKHSSLTQVYRVIASVPRHNNNANVTKLETCIDYLTATKLNKSAEYVIRFVLNIEFPEEMKELTKGKMVLRESKFYKLSI